MAQESSEVVEEQDQWLHAEQTADEQSDQTEDWQTDSYNSPADCGSAPDDISSYRIINIFVKRHRQSYRGAVNESIRRR